ncbi:MAG TPA: hypothetical protein VH061_13610 [Solirubrobacteraceae bacterium]|nr:hypothetical protein [Solirubrobacteraceae bacterium]
MSRRRMAILSGLIVMATAAPARAAVPLPADLVALEQQTAQLQANSERFSFQEDVELPGLSSLLEAGGGSGAPVVLVVAGLGEASITPAQLVATGGLFGLPEERIRQLGETLYTYDREAGRIDGHRPWVRSHGKSLEAAQSESVDPGGLLEGDHAGPQGTFSGLVAELNGALSIAESGPATVDGQRVIEFDAQLDPSPLLERLKLKSPSKHSDNPLGGLGEAVAPGSKRSGVPSSQPTLEMEAFLAPNGLPVRVRVTLQAERAEISERVDTLAINVPVNVQAPPASQIIDKDALTRIERRRQRREHVRQVKECQFASRHSKHKLDCAHLRTGSDSGSLLG